MPTLGDYFLVVSGTSAPQVQAISEHIIERLKESGVRPWHVEGDFEKPSWILLDYSDVIVHIFHEEARTFYNLERLWGDAPQRRFERKVRKKGSHGKRPRRARKARA